MKVVDHMLIDERCDYIPTREASRLFPLRRPDAIVVHYDVCHDLPMNRRAVFSSKLDYHLAIDGWMDSERHSVAQIHQYVPLEFKGAHAAGWNDRAFGVTVVNPGPLVERDGELFTTYGRKWLRSEAAQATMPGTPWKWWAIYTDEEIDTLGQLCGSIAAAYPSVRRIVGHSAVATNGKVDPGPLMPMSHVRAIASAIAGRELLAT
jgi:N-acetyl-anhydromuramyl-L-alanine amidase AmpD